MIQALFAAVMWALMGVYFVGFLLLALALSYLLPFRTIDPPLKALMRGLFRLLFIRVEVEGLQHLDSREGYIFMANHSSMLDTPLVAGFVPGFVRGIEASRQHGWPLYGWVMGRLGNLAIDRGDVHGSISVMRRAKAYLETGGSLMIFPEGHRTTTGKLLQLKKLPFHLARESGRPIAPFTIHGMFQVNNKTSWMIKPGRVTLRFQEPIGPHEIAGFTTLELRSLLENRLKAALEADPAGREAAGAGHRLPLPYP